MCYKKSLFLLFLCSLSLTAAANDYTIYSDGSSLTKGTATSVLNVYMKNVETISALQFDMSLPEGVDVYYGENEDEDMVYFISKGERAKTDHTASYNKLGERKFRVMVSSPTNSTFKETEANKTKPIVVITLDVASEAQCGARDVVIENVVLSHYDAESRTTQPYYPTATTSAIVIRPATGSNVSESANVLSIATADGTKLDAASYTSLTNGKSDAVIDLRATELADAFTVANLKSAGASLYYLPGGSTLTGENIVVDKQCSNYVIYDEKGAIIPSSFSATTATYTRAAGNAWGTICLPFAVASDSKVQYYTLETGGVDLTNGKLTFTEASTVPAGTPAVFCRTEGESLSVSASNVEVKAGVAGQYSGGLQMLGTYEPTTITGDNYFIAEDAFWKAETDEISIPAFRAYFKGMSSEVKNFSISLDNETGLKTVSVEMDKDAIYDLMGRNLLKVQKGINIVNGKKILVK